MKFDVVIVGASSAGLQAARKLAAGGKKVAVLERQKVFKPARRTLIVTPELQTVLTDLPPEAILYRTGTMKICSPGLSAQVQLQNPDLIVERASLNTWLLGQAESAGAQVFLGHRFVRLEADKSGAVVHLHNHRPTTVIATEAIIGADGMNSRVARSAGMPCPPSVPLVQAEVTLPSGWDPDVTQVWFDVDATRFFYWLIPESSGRAVAGLIGEEGALTRELLADFLDQQNLRAENYQGARVAMHHPRFKPWGAIDQIPILLVGDAAGHVKVTTVGGTVTGLQGASAAAASILNGTSYRFEARAIKRELDVHWLLRVLLERLDNGGYDCLVGTLSSRLKLFLARHNRDLMARGFWRLPWVQPKLIKIGLRCLRGRPDLHLRKLRPSKPTLSKIPNPES